MAVILVNRIMWKSVMFDTFKKKCLDGNEKTDASDDRFSIAKLLKTITLIHIQTYTKHSNP